MEERYLTINARRHKDMAAIELAQDFAVATGKTISRQTVYRRLAEKFLYARRLVVCVPLIPPQKGTRRLWNQEDMSRAIQEWGHVPFADESKFRIKSESQRVFIWRQHGTRYHPSNIREFHRIHGCGILVLGGPYVRRPFNATYF
ncbi:transposable element Tcb1 transposase [Trichonephila clavipes]|nr:transposable element Tcb1 transposase [Trichonephila clavipes]